ncbi:hypothetical protein BKA70DRAFT_272532 [Coprinopsis sp. MPI-PUGE-AT-0042]|nr:hypothetical protein BKA70DRAFT_272532 [Coprinopsis sp. MPI-PUGE-AT-0042]
MSDSPSQPQPPDSPASAQVERDALHYHTFAIFRVEKKLYSIPTSFLKQQSEVFSGMFSLDNPSEGMSDDRPIVLAGYKSVDFDSFLKVLIPQPLEPSPPILSKEEWISTLKLATIWQMSKIRKAAIEKLSDMNIAAIDRVALAREYHVATWLQEGVIALATETHTIKVEDMAAVLGWETTARIFVIRDSVLRTALPSADEHYVKTSRLACINCETTPTGPGIQYPKCCSGVNSYGTIYKGYRVNQDANTSLIASPLAMHATAITSSALELFGEEIKALERY